MDFNVPKMSPGCARRAMHAIAWKLSEANPGIEVAVHDERRALPPGAKRLRPAAPLYELDPRGYRRELRPAERGGDLDALKE